MRALPLPRDYGSWQAWGVELVRVLVAELGRSAVDAMRNDVLPYVIDKNTAADHVLLAVQDGKRFCITYLRIRAVGPVNVTFKSGSTVISGPHVFSGAGELIWSNGGQPIFRARATGDDFVMTLSGAVAVQGGLTSYLE
jgi:hypothetical protein